jgi:hypothetical protein
MTEYANLPSPTPKEEQELEDDEASTNKPKFSKINQMLRQAYDLGFLVREVNTSNQTLTEKDIELYDSHQRLTKQYANLKKMNQILMIGCTGRSSC